MIVQAHSGTAGSRALPGTTCCPQPNPKIRAFARAVAHHATLEFREDASQHGIVVARHHNSVEWHAIHEFEERPLDVWQVAVTIHVLAVDVGYDRNDWRELQERTITFVSLGDEILRASE